MGRETRGGPASEKKLEQYGVWVKAEPREVLQSIDSEGSLELSDLEPGREAAVELPDLSDESPLTTEEEKLLDELETEIKSAEGGEEAPLPFEKPAPRKKAPAAGIPAIALSAASDEELPELELEEGRPEEVEVTLSDSLPAEEHFDDLQALEDELASVTSSAGGASEADGHSAEILARIEEELRSIRTDLTELKRQLAGLRRPGAEPKGEAAGAEAAGTFFDEDEDETIALTGDELDNILNTAEITEEAAETPALGEESPALETLAEPDLKAPAAQEDILSYETPILEEDRLAPAEEEAEEVLDELSVEPDEEAGTPSDLAVDLVLEESPAAARAKAPRGTGPASEPVETLAELELDALPEIELAEEGGEPAEMEADLEPVGELEADSEEPAEEVEELGEEPASQVDLDALAIENEEPVQAIPLVEAEDLEIGELEPVADEPAEQKDKEIEIAFEAEPPMPARPQAASNESLEELLEVEEVPAIEPTPPAAPAAKSARAGASTVPDDLKDEIRAVLKYMDHLLEALPEDKIQEFASSDYFVMYKKLFEDLGLGE
jgi:pilus assembly protein FimV